MLLRSIDIVRRQVDERTTEDDVLRLATQRARAVVAKALAQAMKDEKGDGTGAAGTKCLVCDHTIRSGVQKGAPDLPPAMLADIQANNAMLDAMWRPGFGQS